MGVYLNSKNPFGLFFQEAAATYFVDKSGMLRDLIPLVTPKTEERILQEGIGGKGNRFLCVTRPRRFGKTVMASMIASFFSRAKSSEELFRRLEIGAAEGFSAHINQHNVIYISFNEIPQTCASYQEYIERIQRRLRNDLRREFPNVEVQEDEAVWDILGEIYELENEPRFIFILDEWDYIFHRNFVSDKDKADFIEFLSNLLKGKAYVELAYMTGILPIAKYSSGSELNMFYEYTMAAEEKYSSYFGFTEAEVDDLFERYQKQTPIGRNVTREGLRTWYNGYHTQTGERVYNPRSVVAALTNNNLGNYWTSSGPYDEIFYYVRENTDAVRETLALLVSGIPVPAKVREYAATSMELKTRDEILSAMVVYGFLNYENGCVSIPNKELMDRFSDMLKREPSLGYIHRLARESDRMLRATRAGDTKTMEEILEYVHNTESPLLVYNHETELTMIVNLVYLAARDTYRIEREDKAGIGYVDFIFYPVRSGDDCIILELKVDHTAEEALKQIRNKNYQMKFQGKLGEAVPYIGRILAVGIGYDKKDKIHNCKVEILRERL